MIALIAPQISHLFKQISCRRSQFVLLFAGLLVSAAQGQVVELSSDSSFYSPLTESVSTFVDETDELEIEEAVASADLFSPLEQRYIDFGGLLKGRAWLRTTLVNGENSQGIWRLDVNRQYYKQLDIYLRRENGEIQQILAHQLSNSFLDRSVRDRMLGVDFQLAAGESVDAYLGLRADASTFMPLGVGTVEATLSLHSREHTQNVLFNGVLFTFIAFAMLLISVIGWRLATSFALYIFAGFAYVFHADGYTFAYIWPNHMHINDAMNLSLMSLMPVFGLLFCRELFGLRVQSPRLDKFILAYVSIATLVALSSPLLYQYDALKVFGYMMPPLGSITQLAAGIIALRLGLLGSKPYFVGALTIISAFTFALLANVSVGNFNHDATLDYGHFALIVEGLAFISAIAVRLVGMRDDHDRALSAELEATRNSLRLSKQLKKSQDDFIEARQMADLRRAQLSSVSHDIQQPLASLRAALIRIGGADEDARQQMHNAFDYLEKLAREQMAAGKAEGLVEDSDDTLETFPLSAVLDNVKEMFETEAVAKGLRFRYRSPAIEVKTDPMALMRAVSNLVSNAIKHSESGGVILAARKRADKIRIEVWDTGPGMSDEELTSARERYQKGARSSGTGLGLSIVQVISDELALNFQIRSVKGNGTFASLDVPITEQSK